MPNYYIIKSSLTNTFRRVIELDPKLSDPQYTTIGKIVWSEKVKDGCGSHVVLDNSQTFHVFPSGRAIKN